MCMYMYYIVVCVYWYCTCSRTYVISSVVPFQLSIFQVILVDSQLVLDLIISHSLPTVSHTVIIIILETVIIVAISGYIWIHENLHVLSIQQLKFWIRMQSRVIIPYIV